MQKNEKISPIIINENENLLDLNENCLVKK